MCGNRFARSSLTDLSLRMIVPEQGAGRCGEPTVINGNTLVNIPQVLNASARRARLSDWYFAYGSNMNLRQIGARCSRPVAICAARLADYRLEFCGHTGVWDGAVETVVPMPGHEVWGVLFALSPLDWERLDLWQDARMDGGGMYFHFPVTVTDLEGQAHAARLYKKDIQGAPQDPSREYLDHIVCGAAENGLPPYYIEALQKKKAIKSSYRVPMRVNLDLGEAAGISCADCSSDAA